MEEAVRRTEAALEAAESAALNESPAAVEADLIWERLERHFAAHRMRPSDFLRHLQRDEEGRVYRDDFEQALQRFLRIDLAPDTLKRVAEIAEERYAPRPGDDADVHDDRFEGEKDDGEVEDDDGFVGFEFAPPPSAEDAAADAFAAALQVTGENRRLQNRNRGSKGGAGAVLRAGPFRPRGVFTATPMFRGHFPGYVFKLGARGLGYHHDPLSARDLATASDDQHYVDGYDGYADRVGGRSGQRMGDLLDGNPKKQYYQSLPDHESPRSLRSTNHLSTLQRSQLEIDAVDGGIGGDSKLRGLTQKNLKALGNTGSSTGTKTTKTTQVEEFNLSSSNKAPLEFNDDGSVSEAGGLALKQLPHETPAEAERILRRSAARAMRRLQMDCKGFFNLVNRHLPEGQPKHFALDISDVALGLRKLTRYDVQAGDECMTRIMRELDPEVFGELTVPMLRKRGSFEALFVCSNQ